jgi:hypothetical protein
LRQNLPGLFAWFYGSFSVGRMKKIMIFSAPRALNFEPPNKAQAAGTIYRISTRSIPAPQDTVAT